MAVATSVILAAGAVASLAGTAVSFYSQKQQAKAAKQTSNYNAEIQRRQATQENLVSQENLRRKARQNNAQLAQIRAANAGKGLAMEGTPLAVLGDSAMMLQREIQDMSYQASTRYQSMAQGALMTKWEGAQQSKALNTQAVSTLVGGVASAGMGYAQGAGYLPSPKYPGATGGFL